MIGRRTGSLVRLAMLAIVVTGYACGGTDPPENKRPVAVGTIPDTTLVEGESYTVNVSQYFDDPDGDALNYTALSSNASVATATVSGSTLTVRAVAEGTARVTVTATDDGGLSATQSFGVTVERPNRAPVVVLPIPDLTLTEGDTIVLDAGTTFSDPDGDELAITATSDDTGVATVTVDGTDVAVVGVAPGSANVSVTATDPGGLSVTDVFEVTVERRNRAPVPVGEVPPVTMDEGEVFIAPVSQFFEDPDGDPLTYTAESSDTEVVTASMSSDTITVTGVAPGEATITLTATDPGGLSATQTGEFTVEKVNRAPVIADTIPHQRLNEDDTLVLDVTDNFTDPDGDTLTYTAESDDTSTVSVSVDGAEVTIVGVAVGSAFVSVTATDPDGLSVTQAFDVTVQESNEPPVPVDSIPHVSFFVKETFIVTVSQYFEDPDGDTLTYAAESSDTDVVTASISNDTLTLGAVTQGTVTITVTATDPGGLSATQNTEATVVNRAPEPVGEIGPQTLVEDDVFKEDVSQYFTDPDGDSLTYSAESSDSEVVLAWALGDSLTVTALKAGTATVTVTATDPGDLSATQTAEITVKEPNRAPEPVGEIPEQSIVRGDTVRLDVSDYFTDPDGDTLTYAAASSDDMIVTADAEGDTVTIAATGKGKVTVTVTATDPDGLSAEQEISVLVGAPVPVGEIPDEALTVNDTAEIDVGDYFEDPDGDDLSYSVSSSRRSVARPSLSGSTVTIAARGAGRATVTVTATDTDDLSAEQEFRVAVAAPLPVHDMFIEVDTAGEVDTLSKVVLDMAGYFGDTDSAFEYEAETGRDEVADIESVEETVVTTEPLEVDTTVIDDETLFDTTTVTVTATDDEGLGVSQTTMVRVAPVDYEPWELIEINEDGEIIAGGFLTLTACFEMDGFTFGDTVYTVHWSEWQVQKGSGWVQVPGTYAELEVCAHTDLPDEPAGTYRFVGEATVWPSDTSEVDEGDTVRNLRQADNTVDIEDSRPPPPPPDLAAATFTAPVPRDGDPQRPRPAPALTRPRRNARLRPSRRSRRGCGGPACTRTSSVRRPSGRRGRYRRR